MTEKSPEAQAWSTILGQDVPHVHENVPIIEMPSIDDLAARPDWPERRAELRRGLAAWHFRPWAEQVMHGG